ncbi:MAG: YdeI/OmpD-associated family protein [Planctomycetes bacterium]|nr:YdeI/OmpD-associated family protein [Planctomycetota bacterium]
MSKLNASPEVDAYIEKAPPFARPILERIRRAFHRGCPEIQETIKWRVPHFEHHGIVGGMAAFKRHVSFGFWHAKHLDDPHGILSGNDSASMCAIKTMSLEDLPADAALADTVRIAARYNEEKKSAPKEKTGARKKSAPKTLAVPKFVRDALARSRKAKEAFDGFSYSHKKEYVEWIEEAKKEETRERRIATMIEWLEEGKPRHWKYQ